MKLLEIQQFCSKCLSPTIKDLVREIPNDGLNGNYVKKCTVYCLNTQSGMLLTQYIHTMLLFVLSTTVKYFIGGCKAS